MKPQISLFASAARPKDWDRFYNSLKTNQCLWEVVFVGPHLPLDVSRLPSNFIYMKSDCKPAQCYEAAARLTSGELIGWTADDAEYLPGALDAIWEAYLKFGKKTILAQRTIEDSPLSGPDNKDISENHRLIYGNVNTPRMAPLGFMNRDWYMELGGYDRNFISGQSENDLVMRALSDGGSVELVNESRIFLRHKEHYVNYTFLKGYEQGRSYLERCWLKDGKALTSRALPFEPYSDEDILMVNQGATCESAAFSHSRV